MQVQFKCFVQTVLVVIANVNGAHHGIAFKLFRMIHVLFNDALS